MGNRHSYAHTKCNAMSDWIVQCHKFATVHPVIYCCKHDVINMKHGFSLADMWFYVVGMFSFECDVIHFER